MNNLDQLIESTYNGLCFTYINIHNKHKDFNSFSTYVEQHIKQDYKPFMYQAFQKAYICLESVREYVLNNYNEVVA